MKTIKITAELLQRILGIPTCNIGGCLVGVALFIFQVCNAAETASALATVELNLDPQVAVEVANSVVNIRDSGVMGDFRATIDFTVEANTELVSMFVEATDFHFREGLNSNIEPIYLDKAAGVEIDPDGAKASGGNIAAFTGNGESLDSYPSHRTEAVTFVNKNRSNQTFRHPVAVTVTWTLDTIKPAGQWHASRIARTRAPLALAGQQPSL